MTDEYISREAALEQIREYIEEYGWTVDEHGWHTEKWCAMKEAEDVLESIPAADVVPVRHGRWKKVIEDSKYYHMECSKCCGRPLRSRWVDDAELSTFCPWCGARMDKDGSYEDAEEQGRLVRLPCKVGDTVWSRDVEPWTVISVEWFSRKVSQLHCKSPVTGRGMTFSVGNRSLGKTVFLTREEAEAALKGETKDV